MALESSVARDLGQAAIGIGATLLSKFLSLKTWTLKNNDTGETIQGQFPAEDVTRNVGGNWTEIQALNRQNAFLQFLNGKTQTLGISSRFYKRDMFDDSPVKKVETLIEWSQLSLDERRPPLLTFYLGDGLGLQMDVFLENVSDIKYGLPNALGGIRQVTFHLEFRRVAGRQAAQSAEKEVTDTRYARAQDGDYYEKLCQEEYGDPMIGVIIRQRNPTKALLKPGDIIALPALEGVRGAVPTQQSIALKTAFGRKDTPQKQLRIQFFNKRNVERISFL